MAQQTALEWLIEQCPRIETIVSYNILEQAKAMEKEQIEKAFNEGMSNSVDYFGSGVEESEKYYNETYNK
jgi:hypothetical protein